MIIDIVLGIVIDPIAAIMMLVMITDVAFARRHPANRGTDDNEADACAAHRAQRLPPKRKGRWRRR